MTDRELIEFKTGKFMDKINGLSSKDIEQFDKYRKMINGSVKIYDENGNLMDFSDKLVVLQLEEKAVAPMALAQLRKKNTIDIIRFGNGYEIEMINVPFDGKRRKPRSFKGMKLVNTLEAYINIKL
ncbi:hypothetical protein [uncultured Dokdonia sp.]|uniref:hypothetical protein n=1 Tax=uncultured Dokdonia sp. TaxID=575653 RepID=UPI0026287376|nr:hypothetical protein [uncultured Dokdonia sp.]